MANTVIERLRARYLAAKVEAEARYDEIVKTLADGGDHHDDIVAGVLHEMGFDVDDLEWHVAKAKAEAAKGAK